MHSYIVGELLFWSETLDSRLDRIGRAAAAAIHNLPCEEILSKTPEDTLASVLGTYGRERTRLKRETTRSRQTETTVDVQHDFVRGGPYGYPVHVSALKIELVTTFSGLDVFTLQPSTYTLNPPRGYVHSNTIVVGCSIPLDVLDRKRDEAAQDMMRTIDRIEENLQQIKVDTDNWEFKLHDQLKVEIETRRNNCLAMQETSRLLGVSTEDEGADTTTYIVPIPQRQPRKRATHPRTREQSNLEPRISVDDFTSIIMDIQRIVNSFERLPQARSPASEGTT